MRTFIVAIALTVLGLGVAPCASAQSITVDRDPTGLSCYLPVITGPAPGTMYIVAMLNSSISGITGAEFRVTGMPAGLFAVATASPASNVAIGDPLGTGCNIAFPTCQTADFAVLLYTVNYFVISGTPRFQLHVEQHSNPSNSLFQCPLVVLCDAPVYTLRCVFGGSPATGPLLQVPSDPIPADGATNVPTNASLRWTLSGPSYCCGIGTPFTSVHLGTSNPPPHFAGTDDYRNSFDPGPLAPQTTYWWSIVESPDQDCGFATGPTWSFTTGDAVAVQASTWQQVKSMFR